MKTLLMLLLISFPVFADEHPYRRSGSSFAEGLRAGAYVRAQRERAKIERERLELEKQRLEMERNQTTTQTVTLPDGRILLCTTTRIGQNLNTTCF